jgi:hypothetical protein
MNAAALSDFADEDECAETHQRPPAPSPIPCSSASTYRQSMMSNPEPLTARATSKGKQQLLLTSEHVSLVSTPNSLRAYANHLHFAGMRSAKKDQPPSRTMALPPSFWRNMQACRLSQLGYVDPVCPARYAIAPRVISETHGHFETRPRQAALARGELILVA